MEIIRGGNRQQAASLTALVESAETQRDLALHSLIELKVITLHLAEIAGATFDEEDIELETN